MGETTLLYQYVYAVVHVACALSVPFAAAYLARVGFPTLLLVCNCLAAAAGVRCFVTFCQIIISCNAQGSIVMTIRAH
jgi:hypothetical protein